MKVQSHTTVSAAVGEHVEVRLGNETFIANVMDVDDSEGEIHLQYFKLDRNVYAPTSDNS